MEMFVKITKNISQGSTIDNLETQVTLNISDYTQPK